MPDQIDFLVLASGTDDSTSAVLTYFKILDLTDGEIYIIPREDLIGAIQAGVHFKTLRRSTCKKRLLSATIRLSEDGALITKPGKKAGDQLDPLPPIKLSSKEFVEQFPEARKALSKSTQSG